MHAATRAIFCSRRWCDVFWNFVASPKQDENRKQSAFSCPDCKYGHPELVTRHLNRLYVLATLSRWRRDKISNNRINWASKKSLVCPPLKAGLKSQLSNSIQSETFTGKFRHAGMLFKAPLFTKTLTTESSAKPKHHTPEKEAIFQRRVSSLWKEFAGGIFLTKMSEFVQTIAKKEFAWCGMGTERLESIKRIHKLFTTCSQRVGKEI